MKVIQSFNDYYDGALSTFVEQSPLYIRKQESHKLVDDLGLIKRVYLNNKNKVGRYVTSTVYDIIPIGVCGKIYVMFAETPLRDIFGNINSITIMPIDKLKAIPDTTIHTGWWESDIDTIIKNYQNNEILLSYFLKYNTPVFAILDKSIIVNPVLKTLNFQQMMHPFMLAQEIEMYLNNVLCDTSTKKMPVGDDNTILKSKGFDKWSFRTKSNNKSLDLLPRLKPWDSNAICTDGAST